MTTTHTGDKHTGPKQHVVPCLIALSVFVLLIGCGELSMTGSAPKDGVEKGKIAKVYEPWEGDPTIQISNLQMNEDGTFTFDCTTGGDAHFFWLNVCVHLAGDRKPVMGPISLSNFWTPGEKSGTVKGDLGAYGLKDFKRKLKTGCEVYLATKLPDPNASATKVSNSLIYGNVVATVPQPIPDHLKNPPTGELGLVALPQDLVLPAGTMLLTNNRGKYVRLTVLEDCNAGEKVKVKWDERPEFQPTYDRESLMINSLVLQDMRENPFVIEKEPAPDLVPLPNEDLPFAGETEVYVKADGEFHHVHLFPSTIKDPSNIHFRSGALEGKKISRADIYITRSLLNELQIVKSRIANVVRLPKGKILPSGTEIYENTREGWYPAKAVAWQKDDKYKIKYVKTNVTETVERSDLYIDRDLLASIPDPDTTVASAPKDDVELLPGTPCQLVTSKGPVNARVVEQLSQDQIKIERYSKSGPETQLVKRSELRVPEPWLRFLANGGKSEALRPPLEKTPWFKIPDPPKFKTKAFLDLSAKFNRDLRKPFDNSPFNVLQDLEPGYYNMGGTDFHITGQAVQLNGKHILDYKAFVRIPVHRKVNSLEILHSTMYGGIPQSRHRFHVDDGTVVGKFAFEYESGDPESVPIVYGENVREWWSWEPSETNNAELVWTGDNPETQKTGRRLRFYKFTLKNPHPDKKVDYLIYESSMNTPVAPFCVAITVGE